MPVPDFQTLMLPVFKAISGGGETQLSETRRRVAAAERLTVEDTEELLPSVGKTVFAEGQRR